MVDAMCGVDSWPSPVRSTAGHLFSLRPAPTDPPVRGRASFWPGDWNVILLRKTVHSICLFRLEVVCSTFSNVASAPDRSAETVGCRSSPPSRRNLVNRPGWYHHPGEDLHEIWRSG